jgi:hypothetical protein
MVRPRGAYGLRIRGLDSTMLADVPARWAEITIDRKVTRRRPSEQAAIHQDHAAIPLLRGDVASARRDDRSATLLTASEVDDGRLLHPFLTTVAVVFSWWDRRHAFHGGAFSDRVGRAWGVLGNRGAGKSSTLACLSLSGVDVLSDDLLVAEQQRLLVGPRCIDLRPDAAEALGLVNETTMVRGGDRLRLPLGPAPAEVPLKGWIFLTWGERVSLRRLRPSEWLVRLAAQRSTATANAPTLLELANSEAWELCRPHTWDSLEPAVERLLDLAGR